MKTSTTFSGGGNRGLRWLATACLLLLSIPAAYGQYCTAVYSSGCSFGDYIDNFSTTGGTTNITNNATGCTGGTYYSTQTVSQLPGLSFNVSMQSGPSWSQGFGIWVDWNNDLDYADAGEYVFNTPTSGTTAFTGTITVPSGTTPGQKRMRVRCAYVTVPTDPCASYSFGESEEYNVNVLSPVVSYCTPTYSIACSSADFINNFSTTGGSTNISNLNSGCNGLANNYIYYSAGTVTQVAGGSFGFTVQSGSSWGQGFGIWVDWNNDGDFVDAGEFVYNSGTSGTGAFSGSITIPSGTSAGTKRMRVRCAYATVPTDPCANYTFGETEDYNVAVSSVTYCTPTYSIACTSADFINNFSTSGGSTNISNLNSGCNGLANNYIYYPAQTVTQVAGGSFGFTVQSGSTWGQGFGIWVDWNNDGDFVDAGEFVYNSGTSGTGAFSGTITVPSGTSAGPKRMRVRCAYATVPTDPCANYTFGETEDYNVNVTVPVYCTATYSFACSSADFINNFSTTGGTTNISNLNSGCNGQLNNFIYYSGQTVTQSAGGSFGFTVQSGSSWAQGFGIWVDWNNDGDYVDAGEFVYNSGFASTAPFTGSITIPSGTTGGVKRMRVRCAYATVPTDPCANYTFGETEEYNVSVFVPVYCTPTYSFNCNSADFINNFSTSGGATNISNLNTGCNGQPNNYIYYSSQTVTQAVGSGFNFTVQSGSTWGQGFGIWVDWNNDGDFVDAGEFVYNSGFSSTAPFNGTINIPLGTSLGTKRMRVRCAYATVPTDPCALYSFGETEDYNVSVTAIQCSAPSAVTNATICGAGNATVSAVPGANTNTIRWYSAAVGGTLLFTGTSYTAAYSTTTIVYAAGYNTTTGCENSNRVAATVTVNALPVPAISGATVICAGQSTTLTASGGVSYLWSTGATTASVTVSPGATTSYSVTVTSGNGCSASASTTVTVQALPDASFTGLTSPACTNGGTQTLNPATPGGTFSGPGVSGNTFNPAAAGPGTHTVTYTVSNGSSSGYQYSAIPFAALPSAGTSVSLGDDQVSGSLPVGFSFNFFGVNYTQFAISSNGFITFTSGATNSGCCTGPVLPTSFGPTNLIAAAWEDLYPPGGGTIQYYTTGPVGNRKLVVTWDLPHYPGTTGYFQVTTQVILYEGSNVIEIHTTQMNSDGGFHTQGIMNNAGTVAETTPGRNGSNWSAFNDGVRFSPSVSCSNSSSQVVTVGDPASVSLLAQTYQGGWNISCNGASDGMIFANVTGGTAPYSYSWSNGANTQMVSGLTAGTYSVTVTDANGCVSATQTITLTEPPLMVDAISATVRSCGFNISCNGASDGAIDYSVSGGTPPYAYNWSNGATTEDQTGLAAGTYSVTATDRNGCTTVNSITLTEPALLVTTLTTSVYSCGFGVSCFGASNGSVTSATVGGCAPYTYAWSNSGMGGFINGVPAGTYSVTVTDANGCQAFATAEITEPAELIGSGAAAVVNCGYNIGCNGASTGSIDYGATGGCAPYSYNWSNGATTEDVSGLSAGSYSVTVTDANGCTDSDSFTLTEAPALTYTCPTNTTVYYGWPNSACATVGVSNVGGGCAPYSYSWTTGATTASITVCPTVSTDYTVTITDANGCTASCTVRVCVIDVRCGNNLQKIELCHYPPGNSTNSSTLCVSPNAVQNLLNQNPLNHLGACGTNVPCAAPLKTDGGQAGAGNDLQQGAASMEAFPNPFSEATTLRFTVADAGATTLEVFSMTGEKVAILYEGQAEAGNAYEVEWKPEHLSQSIYFARLTTAKGEVSTMKLVLNR